MSDLIHNLQTLAADPAAEDAGVIAQSIIQNLRARCPDADALAILYEYVSVFSAMGLAQPILDAIAPWRATHPEAIQKIEVLVNVSASPAAAAYALKTSGDQMPELQGIEVINLFTRGDLVGALRQAEVHEWFLDNLEATNGFIYAVWTLALQDDFAQARSLVAQWKVRNAGKDARADHHILRVEATMASYRADFAHEVRSLEEAFYIADANDLGLERTFAEAALAAAHAHAGDQDAASTITESWDATQEGSLLSAYRALAVSEIALLSGDWDRVVANTDIVLGYYTLRRNPVLYQHVRFVRALAAESEASYRKALDELAHAVAHLPTRRMLTRVDELEALWSQGYRSPRDAAIIERDRRRKVQRPFARLWYPESAVRADLFVDRIRGLLFAGGQGPFYLSDFPKRLDLLDFVISQPNFQAPAAAAFKHVWRMDYVPNRHENKLHVTAHRLRKMLQEWGAEGALSVKDDMVVLQTSDVRVVETASRSELSRIALEDRILNLLRSGKAMAPSEMETALNVSRSKLSASLRTLLDTQQVARVGKGRSTRYQQKL